MYVGQYAGRSISIFDTNGNLEKIIEPLCRLEVDGHFWKFGSIQCSESDFGLQTGPDALHSFKKLSDVALDSAGNIYIADPRNMKIGVFPPNSGWFVQEPDDDIPPVITTLPNVNLSATNSTQTYTYFYTLPTATDDVSTPVVACTPLSGFHFPVGTTTVTCTATDIYGNVVTSSFTVTVTLAGTEEAPEEAATEATAAAAAVEASLAASDAAAEEIVIPSWIKNNAGWWASNQIDDRAFVSGLQWLITNGVMHIPPTEQGAGSDDVIPGWIKNNAEWWADDLIDDRNFVTGLQWLITNGIMIIG